MLGDLDDITKTTSNFRVTSLVGDIPYPYPFRIKRREAQELIEVPFSAFTAPGSFETKPVWDGRETGEAYFVNYKNHVIWGATAKILKHLVDLLTGGASNQTIKRCLGTAHGELVEPQRFSGIDPSTSSG